MRIMKYIYWLILHMFWIFPLRKSILFMSYAGKYYNDNPKALSDYIKNVGSEFEIIWIVDQITRTEEGIRFVKKKSLKYLFYLATSLVWIDNCRKPYWVRKRKGQHYIQMWHGGIPLKMIEKDAVETLPIEHIKCAKNDSKMVDLMLSNCDWKTNLIKQSFWYTGEIIKCGTPRLDYLFNNNLSYAEKCKKCGLDDYYVYILYAPTFRNSEDISVYNLDYKRICETLYKETGRKYKILFRLHPNMKKYSEEISNNEYVINMTDYPEMYDLLDVSNILITDYSSSMFEAGFLNKIVILYCQDLEQYIEEERELYFEVSELPYIFCKSNDEMIDKISELNKSVYYDRLFNFNNEISIYEDGKSCQLLYKRIQEWI